MYSCTSENRVGAFSCEYLGQASSGEQMPLASGLITITTIQLEVIKLSAITTRVL